MTDLDRLLARLRGVASGLVLDPNRLRVEIGQATAYRPADGTITIAAGLFLADPAAALGGAAHEIGHALVSAYHLVEDETGREAIRGLALNAAEDPRVHAFLRRRTPGVGAWLEALFALDPRPGPGAITSELLGFLGAMASADRGYEPAWLGALPCAAAALDRTREARAAYAHTLPADDFTAPPGAAARYQAEVAPRLSAGAPTLPAPADAQVAARLAAFAAYDIFRARIWPEVVALARIDEARVARALARDPDLRKRAEAAAGRQAKAVRCALKALGAAGRDGGADRPDPAAAKLAGQLMDAFWQAAARRRRRVLAPWWGWPPEDGIPWDGPAERGGEIDGGPGCGRGPQRPPDPAEDLTAQATRLAATLRRLIPRTVSTWVGGQAGGGRLDLKKAMSATATGRGLDRVWMRRLRPARRHIAVLLLVDLSGSMGGPKIAAATAATHLMAAALDRIPEADWGIWGFQDELIEIVPHGQGLTPSGRARIDAMVLEVSGRNPGGHNAPLHNDDGPCLEEAATLLTARGAPQSLLMVISDGGPSGRRSTAADLHTAVRRVSALPDMTLVGLGLGATGTEAVASFYPRNEVNIEPRELCGRLARVLGVAFRQVLAA